MKNLGRPSRVYNQNRLLKLLTTEFQHAHQAYDLFDDFMQHESYNHSLCLRLLAVAKQRTEVPRDIRRLAILMIENQILKLDPDNLDEFDFLFTQLSLKQAPGLNHQIVSSVLKEGYSTSDLRHFIPEFRRKLERLIRVHVKIRGRRTSDAAIRDFIDLSRRDCKLSLARYFFTPEEIVEEILEQLQVTDGVRDLDTSHPVFAEEEMTRATKFLPDFESKLLKRLCQASNIYWVSNTTSSEINSLVEYPLTTVVLVIKPPGSDVEFEIKRAGRKGHNSLNVVYARDGHTVPPSHRLDGGDMQWLLRYEAETASKLGVIYRLVHGVEPSIAYYVARTTIYSVPGRQAAVQTLPYFTEPQFFGTGFREMRAAMQEAVNAFRAEGHELLPRLPGDLGLTAQFIGHVAPAQAILCGTSSFRLDKLAEYLSTSGPEKYFREGLAQRYDKRDEKRLADELLEEILGLYRPPEIGYKTYAQYLEAAFCNTANRVRADRIYLSLLSQIAMFWGTLLAARGYTRGESFVARNVGLKSFWHNGEWKVKIIFMDHDAVVLPEPDNGYFYAQGALPHMKTDERHIWSRATAQIFATSEVGYLESIYRIGNDIAAEGQGLAQAVLKDAYRKTQHALLTNPKLRSLFNERFMERLLDWDTLVSGHLQRKRNGSAAKTWEKEMREMLAAKGYRRDAFESYIEIIENYREFLERNSFLFDVASEESANPSRA